MTSSRPRIAIPMYIYPSFAGSDWNRIANPPVSFVIANVNSGPDVTPNSDYTTYAFGQAHSVGVSVIGYVDTNYSAIDLATVEGQVDSWYSFYPGLVDGIFFDRMDNTDESIPYYQALYAYVKAKGGRALVVGNPGTVFTLEGYLTCADVLCLYEGDATTYINAYPGNPAWVGSYPPDRFWHIIYDTPDYATMLQVDSLARSRNVGYEYITTRTLASNPFAALPADPFWTQFEARVSDALNPPSVARHAGLPALTIHVTHYTVKIAGVEVFVLAGTLSVDMAIGRRSQAKFIARTTTAKHFQQYAAVSIVDDLGTNIFTGYLANPKESKPGFKPSLLHDIQCIDQHYLADKRIIAVAYSNKTCGFMVNDIVTTYLAAEGVTIGAIEDGPTISGDATFAYCSAAAAFDALAARANFQWQIDAQKRIFFTSYTTLVNSTIIDGTHIEQVQTPVPTVERGNPNYTNKKYVLGGVQETSTQVETRKGDGTATAFTFSYPFAHVPTVKVNTIAKTVGIKGVDSGKDWYWSKGDPVLAQDSGGVVLTSSDTLQVTYIGQYPGIFVAQDDSQIATEAALEGTSGIVESVTTDASIQSATDGFTLASQLLARYAKTGTVLKFWTLQSGFAQGQLVTVNLPMHDLNNAQMLIESVSATDGVDSLNIWYNVTAIMGPYDTTWVAFFAAFLTSQQATNPINIGVSQIVGTLASFTASHTPSATLTPTVFTCPICGPATFCGPSTIVC